MAGLPMMNGSKVLEGFVPSTDAGSRRRDHRQVGVRELLHELRETRTIAHEPLADHAAASRRWLGLKSDPEARENFEMAQSKRLILREERNFVEVVEGTLSIPAGLAGKAP